MNDLAVTTFGPDSFVKARDDALASGLDELVRRVTNGPDEPSETLLATVGRVARASDFLRRHVALSALAGLEDPSGNPVLPALNALVKDRTLFHAGIDAAMDEDESPVDEVLCLAGALDTETLFEGEC
ncbi:MAG: hypothetical protein AAGK32_02935 [Actinomycetota bacterium]